jgi:sugar O-acyltransferase (sialic acid O-acetyltransferase NeuD family)
MLTVSRPADFVAFAADAIQQGIHRRFEDRVRIFPERVAICEEGRTLTYAELNGMANSIAEAVLSRCGSTLAQAAILLPNSAAMIAGILGSLKARKAYVPLDANYPLDRLRYMLDDAQAAILLTDDHHRELAGQLTKNKIPVLNLSTMIRRADMPNPGLAADPLERAYILYTSGTTGRPKGIAFLHRNLLHTTMCLTNRLFFSPSDRVTWLHSASFAASVVDIYCCLTNGAALYPWDVKIKGFAGMAEWLARERLTTLQWIPSAFRHLLRTVPAEFRFRDLRIAVMASEPLTLREVELFRRHFAVGSYLVNQVGTSESYNYNLYAIDHEIAIEGMNVPGGYPVSPDREVLILNDAREPLPLGCVGEIAIKSDYMSAGYWRNDEATRAKFIRVGDDAAPVYLTGDMGSLAADGCLTHLGRMDFQIKIRGFRIEIAEVEHALARLPGVADCACWPAKNQRGEDQLIGYVVPRSNTSFDRREAEKSLRGQLPVYMVPRIYVVLEELPYLPSGKIDRGALPNPFAPANARHRAKPVEFSPQLHKVREIFREVLDLRRVSAGAEFFELGGDSLSLAVLQHRLAASFGVELAMDDLSGSLTPARVAKLIAHAPQQQAPPATLASASADTADPAQAQARGPSSSPPLPGDPAVRQASAHERSFSIKPSPADTRDLIVISAGRLGREVFTWATHAIAAGANYRIKGFLDNRADALAGYSYEPGILGSVQEYEIQPNDVFIGAIGDPGAKSAYYTPILERGGEFVNVIHPTAIVGSHIRMGRGIVLAPLTVLTADVALGDHVAIGTFSNIGHDVRIGSWCQIGSHCGVNGRATLGEGVFLGSHVCIAPEMNVGDWAFAGAGSIVVRHVAAGARVFGNPAAAIGPERASTGQEIRTGRS